MFGVLIAEVGLFCWNAPVYAKAVIKDTDASICLWMIELIAFILEHGGLAQYGEAVSEATGYKELLTKLTIES